MNNTIKIEPFTISDLNSISNTLEKDFDDFWNYNIIKDELKHSSSYYLCCKNGSGVVGFAGITITLDIAELNNIVIKKSFRGNGYAMLLLTELIRIAKLHGCKFINLEVSSSNDVAIKLYKKLGFEQVGKRAKYYGSSDALLFTLVL